MPHRLTQVNVEARTGTCSECGPTAVRIRVGNRGHECMTQRRDGKRRYEARRAPRFGSSPRVANGITRAEVDAARSAQGGRCAICHQSVALVIDHNHSSGAFRGLLCSQCNVGLGHFRDDPVRLTAAITYLETRP